MSSAPQTKTTVAWPAGASMNSSSRCSSSSAALLSRFGMSSFSASETITTRRGTIIGNVLAESTRSFTFISPPYMRSTLNARSPSSTISANSAATADFSVSSPPTSV